jgi:HlyD family secretion protein
MPELDALRIDQPVAKPRRRRKGPAGLVWVLLVLVALWWFNRDKLPVERAAQIFSSRKPAAVRLFTVQASGPAGGSGFSAGGYVEIMPPGPLEVSTLVAGKVSELLVQPGDRVIAGQLIARLDPSIYRRSASVLSAQLEAANAMVRLAAAPTRPQEVDTRGAGVASAEARLRQAVSNFERDKYLYEEGVIPLQDFEVSRTAVETAQAEVDALASQLDLAVEGPRTEEIAVAQAQAGAISAQLAELNWKIAQCEIRSPMSGVVYEQLAHTGNWLSPMEGDKRAGAIVSIVDPLALQCWVDVNQRDSAKVHSGQRVLLEADAAPKTPIRGVVAYLMPQASLQKNTVRVIVALEDPPAFLLPEMSLKVSFLPDELSEEQLAALPKGLSIPASAVMDRQSAPAVLVVEGGRAVKRAVVIEIDEGTNVRISEGLSAGEQVILDPANVSEGQVVETEADNADN